MNFISFKNDNNLTYSYHQRGLETPYFPDLEGEKEKLLLYNSSNGKLFKGEHVRHTKHVDIFEGKEITVEFDRPTSLQIDGETILGVTSYTATAEKMDVIKEKAAAL